MHKAIPRGAVALALLSIFVCRSAPDHFTRLQDALRSSGYTIKERAELQPTDWEKTQFDLLKKRSVRLKGVRPIAGEANIYNRFTLIEESYADEDHAAARMNRFQEKPPNLSAEESEYGFYLREGFQFKNRIYVLTTDGVIFEPELHRLASQLKNLTDEANL
jgi:hypothetical protein